MCFSADTTPNRALAKRSWLNVALAKTFVEQSYRVFLYHTEKKEVLIYNKGSDYCFSVPLCLSSGIIASPPHASCQQSKRLFIWCSISFTFAEHLCSFFTIFTRQDNFIILVHLSLIFTRADCWLNDSLKGIKVLLSTPQPFFISLEQEAFPSHTLPFTSLTQPWLLLFPSSHHIGL